jgi:GT2 family glycosyltransferase
MRFPNVLILILNRNNSQNTLECLASLATADRTPRFSAVVIDNGSTDGSPARIRSAFTRVPIIETDGYAGSAGANNAGLRWALEKSFEWILLLDSDATVAPDLIARFLEETQRNPSAAILGAKIFFHDDRDHIRHMGGIWDPGRARYFFPHRGQSDHSAEQAERVDYVSRAALFLHRRVPETIGLMDERFFLLWEDCDYCAKAQKAGFEIWTVPQARVWHKMAEPLFDHTPERYYFWWRNRLLWISRHLSGKEKRQIYRRILWPEIYQTAKSAFFHCDNPTDEEPRLSSVLKEQCGRAACRGITDYFLGRFGGS